MQLKRFYKNRQGEISRGGLILERDGGWSIVLHSNLRLKGKIGP